MGKRIEWEPDGIGCGGHYLESGVDGVRAGVHEVGSRAECHLWTPGCGFSPQKSMHESVAAAKQYAEQRLAAMTGRAALSESAS